MLVGPHASQEQRQEFAQQFKPISQLYCPADPLLVSGSYFNRWPLRVAMWIYGLTFSMVRIISVIRTTNKKFSKREGKLGSKQ